MRELTEQEKVLIRALAPTVLRDRAERAMVVGTTKKGRTIVEMHGQPSEAELRWDRLVKELREEQS